MTSKSPLAYILALALTAVATLAAVLIDEAAPTPNLSMIFVLPVLVSAVALGWRPALLAVAGSVLAYNFFLIEPRYTLAVTEPANVLALLLLLTVAGVVSAVAAQSRNRALTAERAADQALAINALAKSLVGAGDIEAIAGDCAAALSRLFKAPAAVLVETGEDLRPIGLAGEARLSAADMEAARWSVGSNLRTRGGAYPVDDADFDIWPVVSRLRRRAAIALKISGGDPGRPEDPDRLVEIVGGYLAVALDREAYAAQLVEAGVARASEQIKADLLAAVSHDLKTPLSTILFSLQSLQKFDSEHDRAARRELLGLAERETARLSAMVVNLLNVNRLEAGAIAVRAEPASPADLVASALHRSQPSLAGHKVTVRVAEKARPLRVDPALFETALGNVLENAAKYAPNATVEVSAGDDGADGWVEVRDDGPGFSGPIEPLFEKFARGVSGDGRPPGTGLGLAIARGFMEAQGGRVEAANREGGAGARVRLVAPLAP